MELYHNDMSVCAQKVRVVLAEKGLEPQEHHLDLGRGDSHTAEYLKLNPKGVVPTLIDNGHVIIESTVICEYLDDAYPETALRPSDPAERAHMRWWTLVPDAGLHLWCSTVSFALAWRHQDRTEQMKKWSDEVRAQRTEAIRLGIEAPQAQAHLRNYVGMLRKMGQALTRSPWLAGDSYSLADIAMLPYVLRLDDMAQTWIWEESDEMRPISAWLEACRARPGYAGITRHLNASVVDMMKTHGAEDAAGVRNALL
jgi:glutathione S-transferase